MSISIPIDIVAHAIARLAEPSHPLAYGHARDVLDALLALSLVSHDFRAVMFPYMFRTIRARSAAENSSLAQSPLSLFHVDDLKSRGFRVDESLSHAAHSLLEVFQLTEPRLRRLIVDYDKFYLLPKTACLEESFGALKHELEKFAMFDIYETLKSTSDFG